MKVLECVYISQALNVLEGLLPPEEERKDIKHDVLTKLIVFSIMWSLGAVLELDDRKKVRVNFSIMGLESGDILVLAFSRVRRCCIYKPLANAITQKLMQIKLCSSFDISM